MSRKHFLENQRFDRLLVISYEGKSKYKCICDCGTTKIVYSSDLLKGKVKSCGCLNNERLLKIENQRFGKLLVLERSHKDENNHYFFLCRCDCGVEKIIRGKDLTAGKVKSCGNHIIEAIKKANTTHGDTNSRLYNIHKSMVKRCGNKRDKNFPSYGGRGIKVCNEWLGDNGYLNFKSWAVSNGYDGRLTIDRIDVNGDYKPSNCRWADAFTQANNRRNTLKVTLDDEEKSLAEWCRDLNLSYGSVWKRIYKYDYDPVVALTINTHKLSIKEESE